MSNEFLVIARALAILAGRRVMELRQTTLRKERKADRSLVTNADHEADRIIRDGLIQHFPKHAVLTEESGLEGDANAEFLWLVDPLDGTKAYARGTAGFSVMIGLLRDGQPYAGVVMDPWEDRVYEAARGEGAFHTHQGQRERVKVSERKDWPEMPLVTSTDFPERMTLYLKEKLPTPRVPSINSVGIKVGLLVRQVADLYLNHHPVHYWDTAAPQLILEEAGGSFTFSTGESVVYDFRGGFRHASPTVATNGQRHADFISIIQGIL